MNKQELRKLIRKKRRALTPAQRHIAGRGLIRSLHHSPKYLSASRVALYLTNDGEIDPLWAIEDLWKRGKEVYLPVLHPIRKGYLAFIRYRPETKMRQNRFGIAEPDFRFNKRIPARFISIIGLPLVAFDSRGNRLGMGGGFYDRTLAFSRAEGQAPTLVGCAYAFQEVRMLPAESWDIPLQYIATDKQLTSLTDL